MSGAFDFLRFCRDIGVSTLSSGHKHCRPGWIQVPCPFCTGNPGWHLGFNVSGGNMNCWRCGAHSLYEYAQEKTRLSHGELKELLATYGLRPSARREGETQGKNKALQVHLPEGCGPLGPRHREYLESRRYDPDWLAQVYDVQGCGPIGRYKYRIIAPIYVDGRLVSYQGRDITGRAETKYKACRSDEEVIDHKECLYAADLVQGSACVVVEGITDAWRLGPGAVATFGIKFKPAQIKRLARFNRVFIFFDTDVVKGKAESLIKAEQLSADLASLGIAVELLSLGGGDPADMEQDDADHLMAELGLISS